MLINKKHFIFLAVLLVTMMSVAVAADVNDSTTESTTPAVTHTTDNTDVQTTVLTENEITKKVDNNIEKEASKKENTRYPPKTWNLTNENFSTIITSTGLNNDVSDGDTLYFLEDIYNDTSSFVINKAVNIDGNGKTLNLNTIYGYDDMSNPTYIEFNNQANNSNITNLKFHNTQVFTTSASNIVFDNINVTVDNRGVGKGTGYFAMRTGVSNITVKNSYFHAVNNTGCSAVVITFGENCTIDNNTIIGQGTVGNLVYLNRFGQTGNGITQNKNNTISNNIIIGPDEASSICHAITIGGPHNHIINNTINYTGIGIVGDWAGTYNPATNTTNDYYNDTYLGNGYINNTINNASFTGAQGSLVAGNTFTGTATIAKNSNVKYNRFDNTATIKEYSNITNNIFQSDVTLKNNINFKNNNAENSTVYVNGANCDLCNDSINILDVGSSATNTRVCWDNNINTIVDPYEKVVRYFHQVSLNFNKKKNLSVKGDGEPLIVDVTEENFNTYFRKNNAYDYYYFNPSSDMTVNLYYVPSTAKKIYFDFQGQPYVCSVIGKNDLTLKNVQFYAQNIFLTISDIKLIYDEEFDTSLGARIVVSNYNMNTNQYVTLNNITVDAKVEYSETIHPVIRLSQQLGKNIVIKNSFINVSAPSIDDTYEVIAVREPNSQLINNTINIKETYSVGDNPSLAAIGIDNIVYSSTNDIFENNNITITGEEASEGKLYAIKMDTNGTQIKNNNITITSDTTAPAIEINGNDNTVTDNYIIANDKKGDNAVTATGENNVVQDNTPLPPIEVDISIVSPETININEETPVVIIIKDADGNPINNEEAVITIDDGEGQTRTVENGIIIYNLTPTQAGTLTFNVTLDPKYAPNEASKEITVNEDKDAIIAELNNTVNNQTEIINSLNETVNNQNETINQLNNTVNEQATTIDTLNETTNTLNKTIEEQENTISNLNTTIQEQENTINTLNTTVENLTTQLDDANKAIDEQNKTLQEQQATIEDLNNTAKAQEKTIQSLNKTTQEQANAIEANTKQIEQLQKEIEELKKQNTTTQKATTIKYDTIKTQNKDSTVKITGKLLSDNKAVANQKVTVKVNTKTYTTTTTSTGAFTVNHKVTDYNQQKVTYSYAGNNDYKASTATTTFNVTQPTTLKVFHVKIPKKGTTTKVSGKLLDANGKGVKGQTVKIVINGKTYTAKTYSSGYFTIQYKVDSYDKRTVTFTYAGNAQYKASKNTTTFEIYKPTKITTYKMKTAQKGTTIKVSGKLLDVNGKGVGKRTVTVKINNKSYTAKTYNSGYFTVQYKTTTTGTNKVEFTFSGTALYQASKNSTTFQVKA